VPSEPLPRSPEPLPECRQNGRPGQAGTAAQIAPEYAIPAQVLLRGRQLVLRLLAWRPTLPTLFRLLDAL
jgi:hypothetical protein